MLRRLQILGHPVHPPLTDFPIVLWTVAWGLELAHILWPERFDAGWVALVLGVGLLTALPTIITGFWEYFLLPPQDPAQPIAVRHLTAMLLAFGLFFASWIFHKTAGPSLYTVLLSTGGQIALLIGGWYGGELVFRHGIGVKFRQEEKNEAKTHARTDSPSGPGDEAGRNRGIPPNPEGGPCGHPRP